MTPGYDGMKRVPVVEILWLDAEDMEPGWGYFDDPNIELTVTYGLKAGEDEHWLYHASTYNPHTGEWAGRGKIPIGMVYDVIEIGECYYDTEA